MIHYSPNSISPFCWPPGWGGAGLFLLLEIRSYPWLLIAPAVYWQHGFIDKQEGHEFLLSQVHTGIQFVGCNIAPSRTVILFLRALKPGIDSVSLWIKVFSGIYCHNKVLFILNLCSGKDFSAYLEFSIISLPRVFTKSLGVFTSQLHRLTTHFHIIKLIKIL